MKKIKPCLWFNNQAEEAVNFYTGIFTNSKVTDIARNTEGSPAGAPGTVLTMGFTLEGFQFMALNGGPEFTMNPSISFFVHCSTADEVQALWNKLSDEGTVRMPLDKYPFSDKYGWIEDKFGVSWQLMLPMGKAPQKMMPCLMFVGKVAGKAEEAISFYTSIFHDAKVGNIARYGAGMLPDKEGTVMYGDFILEGEWFAAMDSAREHNFAFNEGISLVVTCEKQDEVDYYWDKLSEGGQEVECGWLKDKYGVAWQVVPAVLPKLLQDKDAEKAKRVMQAMLKMKKLEIAGLEEA